MFSLLFCGSRRKKLEARGSVLSPQSEKGQEGVLSFEF